MKSRGNKDKSRAIKKSLPSLSSIDVDHWSIFSWSFAHYVFEDMLLKDFWFCYRVFVTKKTYSGYDGLG